MLAIISPAKSLDFESPATVSGKSEIRCPEQSQQLVEILKDYSPQQLGSLMGISDKLASLNAARYAQWQWPFKQGQSKQAILAFTGDVYTGLDASTLSEAELEFAQKHLRILSGLYGVLRPLDCILPYRLEMGTRLSNPAGKDLYAFWDDRITALINEDLKKTECRTLVNLASNEYFKAIKPKKLQAEIVTPVFKDCKDGQYKVISFYAKKARGRMCRFIIENGITQAEDVKMFDSDGYRFEPSMSNVLEWVFTRNQE